MLSFRDIDGTVLRADLAKAVAIRRHEEQGGDQSDMVGIMRRMDDEEDAREMFTDITGIEVFKQAIDTSPLHLDAMIAKGYRGARK